MKAFRTNVMAIAGLVLLGLFATTANAQDFPVDRFKVPFEANNARDLFVGHFSLPGEVNWGSTVLPAGDYTVSVRPAPPNLFLANKGIYRVTFTGAGKATAINAMGELGRQVILEKNRLVATRHEGKLRIDSLYLRTENLTVSFSGPKGKKMQTADALASVRTVSSSPSHAPTQTDSSR